MAVSATIFLPTGTFKVTLATVIATNTITLNAVVFTCQASGATGNDFNVGGTDTITATNLAAAINGSVTAKITGVLTATSSGAVVTISGGLVSYASTGTMTLQAVGIVNQPVPVLVTVANSGGSDVNISDASLTVSPDGLTYSGVAVNRGVIALGPGQNLTVPAGSSLVLPSGVIAYMAPQGQTLTYDVGALITTSNTSPPTITAATVAVLSVTGTVVG